MSDVMSLAALGSRPTQPGAGLPPVQAGQSSQKGHNAAHNGLMGPIRGDNMVRDRWRRRHGDGVRRRCRIRHLRENGEKSLERS